jgi:hypothetical protein
MLRSATVLAGPVAVIVGRSVMPRTEELSDLQFFIPAGQQSLASLAPSRQSGETWISERVIPLMACYMTCVSKKPSHLVGRGKTGGEMRINTSLLAAALRK